VNEVLQKLLDDELLDRAEGVQRLDCASHFGEVVAEEPHDNLLILLVDLKTR